MLNPNDAKRKITYFNINNNKLYTRSIYMLVSFHAAVCHYRVPIREYDFKHRVPNNLTHLAPLSARTTH